MGRSVTWVEGLTLEPIDPADVASIEVDCTSFLEGDAITGANSVGTNITIDNTTFSGFIITVDVSAGIVDTRAQVRFTLTTATETHNRSFYIDIKDL